MKDTARHQGLRNRLVENLKTRGITDQKVLQVIAKIPRHLFLDSSFEDFAYQDLAFPIGAGQTISQPYTVAKQTELLEVFPGAKVLEIGTGSGYQTAVLCALETRVFTIERQFELYRKTLQFLPKIGCKPRIITHGDGYKGLPLDAPYDRIIVTAGAPYIPKALMAQLKIGGRMVIPVGEESQKMYLLIRTSASHFEQHEYGDCKFVPMLEDKEK